MKIKRIKTIKNLGIFNNFQWQGNCQEFAQYNFFYGWNYSGKTTLSRVLRSLEIKGRHKDFPDMEFSIETDNGIITHRDLSNDYPIRVFNEDFVEENFLWNNEDATIPPVLILGKVPRELEEQSRELENKKVKMMKDKEEKRQETQQKKKELEKLCTEKASEIRGSECLDITNQKEFDREKLKEYIDKIKADWEQYILSKEQQNKLLTTYRSRRLEQITLNAPGLKLSAYIKEVRDILNRKVSAQEIIEKLKANPELNDWVRKGIDLHRNEQVCQFCGNPLPSDLFERLNMHFSQEFENLINDINKKEEDIKKHIDEINSTKLPDKARLYEDLQQEFEMTLNSFNNTRVKYIENLEFLTRELKRKREKPFDSLELQDLTDNTNALSNDFENIRRIINQHNSRTESFDQEKLQAREQLINHFTAEFIKEKNYFQIEGEITKLEEDINNLTAQKRNLEEQISEIKRKIKAEAIGADTINKYLTQFFNDDKIKIELTDDGKYKLYRKGQIAKNLSTGEKNIISLIYFFARLEENNFASDNAIIFIDDPVSSLDSNHIFKVFGFICEKLKGCGQLFITTHNFDFFNLLKDLKQDKEFKEKNKFYLVKKVRTQTGEFPCALENLPKTLLKHKSEYNYLFSLLKEFNDSNDKSNFEFLYIVPNILRRFFEAYLFMKYPDGKRFSAEAEKFLQHANECDKKAALKLMNEYSHEENPTHTQKFPDIQEVESVIKFIFNSIKEKDKEHFDALMEAINESSDKK